MTDEEFNEAVAKKLGWKYHEDLKPVCWETPGDSRCFLRDLPDYCHSIEAAWEIVEYVNADRFRIIKARIIPEWSAVFEFQNLEDKKVTEYFASEDTLPRAICEAFLKLP